MSLVVVTDSNLPSVGAEDRILEQAGHEVRRLDAEGVADLISGSTGAAALIVQWLPIGEEVFSALPQLRFVSRLGIGVDMIDLDAATRHGVLVANTPDYCIEEVAAHTVALLLCSLRGVAVLDRAVRSGVWSAVGSFPRARRPSATTIAVVGYGRIGRRVAASCVAMGFDVLVVDPFVTTVEGPGVRLVAFEEALAAADAVTLHAPLTENTHHLIDAAALALMRRDAILVNTCRGALVAETDLAAALSGARIGGAALDVFESEPLPSESALREAPNVILTPHSAWYSPESLAELPIQAARNVIRFLAGEPVGAILNPAAAGFA